MDHPVQGCYNESTKCVQSKFSKNKSSLFVARFIGSRGVDQILMTEHLNHFAASNLASQVHCKLKLIAHSLAKHVYSTGWLIWSWTGLGRLEFWVFHCLPNSASADGNFAEAAGQMGKVLEHPNQSQPNPGPLPDESHCSNMIRRFDHGRNASYRTRRCFMHPFLRFKLRALTNQFVSLILFD